MTHAARITAPSSTLLCLSRIPTSNALIFCPPGSLRKAVLFGPEDEAALRQAGQVLADQIEDVLDVWYGFVASHPHLVYYFTDGKGNPDQAYLAAVRRRFGQWILDTCQRPYDRTWLDYQQEIGLRHLLQS